MVPESWLPFKCKTVRLLRTPNNEGIEPERLLYWKLKEKSDFKFPISGGMEPDRELPYICNHVSFSELPILEGMRPVRLLFSMLSSSKLERFPISLGTLP